eukprot:8557594-Pyramimonas_sp.AAC.1
MAAGVCLSAAVYGTTEAFSVASQHVHRMKLSHRKVTKPLQGAGGLGRNIPGGRANHNTAARALGSAA